MTDGRVTRGQASREQRRAQIKATSLEVFASQGYHATSVTDLVQAAGVARGTFYLYFDSKDALFIELLDDLILELRTRVRGVDPSPGAAPLREQLHGIVARVLRAVVENRPLTRILFREAIGLDEAVDQRLEAFNQGIHGYVVSALQLGQELGMIRAALHTDVAAICVVGAVRHAVQQLVVNREDPPDVEALAAGIVDFSLAGVGDFAPPSAG